MVTALSLEELFVVCAQSAAGILAIAEILGTLQMLALSNTWWICATGLCGVVNLIFLFLLPVLGHIDWNRIAHSNTAALSLMAVLSFGSAVQLLSSESFLNILFNRQETMSQESNLRKRRLTMLYVWGMFLSLAFGSIAFIMLAVFSFSFESKYPTVLLSIFCVQSVLDIRFIPFKWICEIVSGGSTDSALSSQKALKSSSSIAKITQEECDDESQNSQSPRGFDYRHKEPC
ncbi:hypothetical protein AA0119_g13387 [Alternaria tenuissima]|uniref:Uncharacterized protein n=1 Tax=Alternaria tenuissima TaxID=119927 RepID=A0ABY0FRW4_9PLEO|nr:hypothetical protein AA0119_g13387 [Alternaria tenuissima]RYO01192.1 hypothetical protein AA0121_g13275 [Alternaria tenuissima]RYO48273.1 hypothetical protein AA0116_g12595 [Alternaria tenuissima]